MEWITIVLLIVLGLALLIVEIIFIPGTTFVGAIGFVLMMAGVAFTFKFFGTQVGWLTFGATSVVSGLILYYSLTTGAWDRFSSKSSIDSKVNEGDIEHFKVGMEGIAISALRPIGKAEINSRMTEVKTNGEYLDANVKVRIIRIVSNQIIVAPI